MADGESLKKIIKDLGLDDPVYHLADFAKEVLFSVPNGLEIVINEQGDAMDMHPQQYYQALIGVFELACAHRGTQDDFYCLAAARSDFAKISEGDEAIKLYRQAIESFTQAKKIDGKDYYTLYWLADAQIELAHLLDDKEVAPLYKQAIENLQIARRINSNHYVLEKLGTAMYHLSDILGDDEMLDDSIEYSRQTIIRSGRNKGAAQHYLGRALADKAEKTLEYGQKIELFWQAIAAFETAIWIDGLATDFWYLADTQDRFADDIADISMRKILREAAIDNLKKAYSIDKDPDTLNFIKEIERRCAY